MVFSLFIVFGFSSAASAAIPDCEFTIYDFSPPPVPEGSHYIITIDHHTYNRPYWSIAVTDTDDYIFKPDGTGNIIGPCLVKQYTLNPSWDSLRGYWYIPEDWVCLDSGSNLSSGDFYGFGNSNKVAWHSMDIYSEGVLFLSANPIPAPPVPPLVELANLNQVMGAIGGTATPVLKVSLMILAILLVISLVPFLVRSWLLRRV